MLRLSEQEHFDATEAMAKALHTAEQAGMRTMLGRAAVLLEVLGQDFDVQPIDPGPEYSAHFRLSENGVLEQLLPVREDITSGNVFGCAHCGSEDHETADHDSVLMERILAETTFHNRGLGAS